MGTFLVLALVSGLAVQVAGQSGANPCVQAACVLAMMIDQGCTSS